MRDKFVLLSLVAMFLLGIAFVAFPDGAAALLLVLIPAGSLIWVFRYFADDKRFITQIFFGALMLRLLFGIIVHLFDLRDFFGGDANTYDFLGSALMKSWLGQISLNDPEVQRAAATSGPGWGMNYLVAFIYLIVGRNIFAAQSFCAVIGAATAPMVYFCANRIFQNHRVSRVAAIAVALFPSFIIWSGQLLKDGLIIFLLVLAMTMVLQLQDRFSYGALLLLFFSLVGILALRFYIFYMVAIAVIGSFLVGTTNSAQSLVTRTAVLVILGLGLTYFGITRSASADLDKYGNLEQLQSSRFDLARSANTGFAEDVDVSTTEGAISIIPLGLAYLMLAPFPWEVSNFRQSITLPEVLLWWTMIPLMIYGMWWSIRYKLRSSFPILIFSLMLTLAYSVFQGNVGTAYRQRTQIQVFLFMFVAVGWQLYQERKENKKILDRVRKHKFEKAFQARTQ